jgi:hypothetical protein
MPHTAALTTVNTAMSSPILPSGWFSALNTLLIMEAPEIDLKNKRNDF